MLIKHFQLWRCFAAVGSTCNPTMHWLESGKMSFSVASQGPFPALLSTLKCVSSGKGVQATCLVAPGLSEMLFKLTR